MILVLPLRGGVFSLYFFFGALAKTTQPNVYGVYVLLSSLSHILAHRKHFGVFICQSFRCFFARFGFFILAIYSPLFSRLNHLSWMICLRSTHHICFSSFFMHFIFIFFVTRLHTHTSRQAGRRRQKKKHKMSQTHQKFGKSLREIQSEKKAFSIFNKSGWDAKIGTRWFCRCGFLLPLLHRI